MPTTLLDTLATLPSGRIARPLSLDEMSGYLRTHYWTQDEKDRYERHRVRDVLYSDGGVELMHQLIDAVYTDPLIRAKRKQWAKVARFNNITKRIVNELSSCYQEPAVRSVTDDDNNVQYQMALALCGMHPVSQRFNRALNLHRAILVGPRVRAVRNRDGSLDSDRRPVIDICSPANATLITHPNDSSEIVAVATRMTARTVHNPMINDWLGGSSQPEWIVWSDSERFMMSGDWRIISRTYEPHSLGRIPWVFVSLEPPGDASPWPGMAGEDLINGDLAAWFSAVSLLKETKSATRQQVLSGNLDAVARDQAAESEVPLELPDGVAVSSQDMSMDLSMFRDTADHVLEHVANNYGMSAALIKHQGVQSAEARELMRVPLREKRREQQMVLRPFERELAETMAVVFRADMPEIAFEATGWQIDFGEAQTPLSPKEELERFEHERRLGLTNTIEYVMSRNPDMDRSMAEKFVIGNVTAELWRNQVMRPLQKISGSMGAQVPADVDNNKSEEELAS